MFVPSEIVFEQRLAEPIVIKPRQPLGLREEVVDAAVGFERERLIVEQPLEPHAGELVRVVVPFAFVVLLEERAIAHPADFGLRGPILQQSVGKFLAMVPEGAAAESFLGNDVAAVGAEIVVAAVVDRPQIGSAAGGTGDAEETIAIVFCARAKAEAALAQVVEVEVPTHAVRRMVVAEQLEHIELGEHLEAEHRVVANAEVVEVIGRPLEVGRKGRPVEDGDAVNVQEVAFALQQVLVRELRLACLRIDNWLAGGRIDHRQLRIGERDVASRKIVARLFQAAGGDEAVLCDEVGIVELANRGGTEADQALILDALGDWRGASNSASRMTPRWRFTS